MHYNMLHVVPKFLFWTTPNILDSTILALIDYTIILIVHELHYLLLYM